MELDPLYGQFPVANSHDDSVFGFGRNFQARRKRATNRVQGMIAAHRELCR